MNKKNELWSSLYEDWICKDYLNCRHCDEDCMSYDGKVDYDFLDEIIMEDLNEKFAQNDYDYFVVGVDYINYYGLPQNMNGYSGLYHDVKSLIFSCLCNGGCYEGFRIYKGKRNSVFIERSHHDGKEYYQLCRLNKMGEKYYYELGYDIDYRNHMIKGVLKDFDYFEN